MMSVKNEHTILITLTDGKTMKFSFPLIEGSSNHVSDLMSRVEEMSNFVLEADGKLIVIPMASIRMIELSPAPVRTTIRGVLPGAKSIK